MLHFIHSSCILDFCKHYFFRAFTTLRKGYWCSLYVFFPGPAESKYQEEYKSRRRPIDHFLIGRRTWNSHVITRAMSMCCGWLNIFQVCFNWNCALIFLWKLHFKPESVLELCSQPTPYPILIFFKLMSKSWKIEWL